MMDTARVVVIGSANADLVVQVDRRPGGGETILGGDLATMPGGKGANQAVAAAKLGADVVFIGCVGDDAHGGLLRDSMAAAGTDLSRLRPVDAPTGVAIITITPDGENSIVVAPGANARLSVADVEANADVLTGPNVVVLQQEIPQQVVARAALLAAASGARVVLNAAPAARPADEVLAVCDPLVVNEHEAAVILGAEGAVAVDEDLAGRLLAMGPRSVIVTTGPQGALVADSAGAIQVPSPDVVVVDTTGAGDAFVGALAGELASGAGLRDAAAWAARVGATAVASRGAQPSYPARAEVVG